MGSTSFLHFDGETWSRVDIGAADNGILYGVWGLTPDDLFVAGSDSTIIHYDGGEWVRQSLPVNEAFKGIWGSQSDDVYVTGSKGSILHYDGDVWTVAASFDGKFPGILGFGADRIFAVGSNGASGMIVEFDGKEWSQTEEFPNLWLNSIWGSSPSDIYACGHTICHGGCDGIVLHYDGENWMEVFRFAPPSEKSNPVSP